MLTNRNQHQMHRMSVRDTILGPAWTNGNGDLARQAPRQCLIVVNWQPEPLVSLLWAILTSGCAAVR
jgi:hypothetical protein